MTDPLDPTRNAPAASIQSDSPGASRGLSARAIALLNYTQVLQEYLEEHLPSSEVKPGSGASAPAVARHDSALHALASITALLTSVGFGKAVDATESKNVLTEAHVRFVNSGLMSPDSQPPQGDSGASSRTSDTGTPAWCIPEWCITKLYEGIEALIRDASAPREAQP